MGIYLGQLPPAELARLKAEIAETIIANFCYPRFYDYRTNTLRVRPVDRAKRQEVWLFLSSVDFTTWGRIDLLSPDFQRQMERLFIQFVQRNRSFFGTQGRKRMTDVRMLIGSSAATIAQGLRVHLSGQKQGNVPFGSPRSAVSWSAPLVTGKADSSWEQVAASTMMIQQQLQELRGEMPASAATDGRANQATRRSTASRPLTTGTENGSAPTPVGGGQQPASKPVVMVRAGARVSPTTSPLAEPARTAPARPAATMAPIAPVPGQSQQVRPAAAQTASVSQTQTSQVSVEPQATVVPAASEASFNAVNNAGNRTAQTNTVVSTPPTFTAVTSPAVAAPASSPVNTAPLTQERVVPAPAPVRGVTYPASPQAAVASPNISSGVSSNRDSTLMRSGEDDLAMFEELRAQLIVWLRIEAIRSGLDISEQNPTQLLELLRQQGHLGETRLQVVSTLLNLANQVLKNGLVSVLDYKQAMMFHLMHTRYMNR